MMAIMAIVPWRKTGNTETIAQGFGKRLDKQQFQDHKGRTADFYFIEQPSWSVVLPITAERNVVLKREFKQGAEKVMTEIPGGTANFEGESPEAVVRRELLEETGYEAAEIIPLGSGFMNTRNSRTRYHCFLAKGCRKIGEPQPDESEQIEHFEQPLEEWALDMLRGETDQWDAVLLLLRALPHLGIDLRELVAPLIRRVS